MQPKDRLKTARESLGLTQKTFGEPIGLSYANVRDLESGKVKISTLHALAIEKIHRIDADWLLREEGAMMAREANQTQQRISGKNNVQIGGSSNGSISVNDIQSHCQTGSHPLEKQIEDICTLLYEYATPKLLGEIKEKLIKIKDAMK